MTVENQNDAWSACPAGTFQGIASQLHRQQLLRRLVKATVGIASGLTVAAAVVLLLFSSSVHTDVSDTSRGGSPGNAKLVSRITCREVLNSRDQYLLGRLSDEVHQRIRTHLGYCGHCQAAYRERAQELRVEFTVWYAPPASASASLLAAVEF